jgi:predicted metalloendopeptidase
MTCVPFTLALGSILALGSAVACDATRPPVVPSASPPSLAPGTAPAAPEKRVALGDVGLDATALDRTADPCQDFYQYACGGWLAKNEIPADRVRWGRNLEVAERNQNALRSILESASSQANADPTLQAVGTFYSTCVDDVAREAAGTKGIDPLLKKVRSVRDLPSLVAAVVELHRHGIFSIFVVGSEQDSANATRVIARLDQGDIGVLDRQHYVDDDARSKEIRTHYLDHVSRMMQLAGKTHAEASKAAADVMALETKLAKHWKTPIERRDPSGMYNKVDRAGLASLTPTWSWDAYFQGLGFEGLREINVAAPAFLQGLEKLLASTKPAVWRAYLEWQLLSATAAALPKRFDDESFAMRRVLTGQERLPDRWKRCVAATDEALGEALGRLFVARHFTETSRDAVRQMVAAISTAFSKRLGELDWMDETTKARAREKSEQMAYLIGYPSTWRAYDFALDTKVHAANVLAGQAFEVKRQLTKVGKPVDREDWQMSLSAVNAYYDSQLNQMAFPAGVLQPPFYSPRASLAVNMGSTGETIGHELTHGFDDAGSQFDAKGDLTPWWDPETRKRFDARTQCVVDQYSAYENLGVKINGKLTLGENIADLGGLTLAFRAYRALREGAEERLLADGFDEDQQFFLSYGQSSCTKWREARERTLLQTGTHSPRKYRVNGPVTNMPEFASAFSCAEGTALNPKQRCEVW